MKRKRILFFLHVKWFWSPYHYFMTKNEKRRLGIYSSQSLKYLLLGTRHIFLVAKTRDLRPLNKKSKQQQNSPAQKALKSQHKGVKKIPQMNLRVELIQRMFEKVKFHIRMSYFKQLAQSLRYCLCILEGLGEKCSGPLEARSANL